MCWLLTPLSPPPPFFVVVVFVFLTWLRLLLAVLCPVRFDDAEVTSMESVWSIREEERGIFLFFFY